jgi:Cu(I)/Ag(I) efflux system membrane fusion protein
MKTLKTLLFTALLLLPMTVLAQQKHQHKEHLKTMISDYLEAQQALAADDMDTAKQHIQSMLDEATGNAEMKHHKQHAEMHAKHHGKMVASLTEAVNASDVSKMRESFKGISDHLIMAAKRQGVEQTLYVQYCPMAKASWLSSNEEIDNPYYGSKMPKCGTVKETLEAQQ